MFSSKPQTWQGKTTCLKADLPVGSNEALAKNEATPVLFVFNATLV
jgi:hypothetical protein